MTNLFTQAYRFGKVHRLFTHFTPRLLAVDRVTECENGDAAACLAGRCCCMPRRQVLLHASPAGVAACLAASRRHTQGAQAPARIASRLASRRHELACCPCCAYAPAYISNSAPADMPSSRACA
eukprot:321764-Chlamydomonas_euryale.AAC.6